MQVKSRKEYLHDYYVKNKAKIRIKNDIWYAKNKEQSVQTTKERRLRNKLKAIEYLGGVCKHCQQEYHHSVYEFHHVVPEEKEFKISILLQHSFESLKQELDKCILLCGNCHNYHHYKEANPDE